jgi:large subunit ribosomal protein L35
MGKMKTRKSISKRFRVTKSGKVIKRTSGQGHYNSRETGKVKRNKRSDVVMSKTIHRFVKPNV